MTEHDRIQEQAMHDGNDVPPPHGQRAYYAEVKRLRMILADRNHEICNLTTQLEIAATQVRRMTEARNADESTEHRLRMRIARLETDAASDLAVARAHRVELASLAELLGLNPDNAVFAQYEQAVEALQRRAKTSDTPSIPQDAASAEGPPAPLTPFRSAYDRTLAEKTQQAHAADRARIETLQRELAAAKAQLSRAGIVYDRPAEGPWEVET